MALYSHNLHKQMSVLYTYSSITFCRFPVHQRTQFLDMRLDHKDQLWSAYVVQPNGDFLHMLGWTPSHSSLCEPMTKFTLTIMDSLNLNNDYYEWHFSSWMGGVITTVYLDQGSPILLLEFQPAATYLSVIIK